MQGIRSHLEEWADLWRVAIPSFGLDSLRRAGWAEFRPAPDAQPWPIPGYARDSSGANSDAAFVLPGPGGRYVLLIDRYGMVMDEGEPESAPVLLDRGRGMTATVEFCGTPCAYHWGAWIDSTRFVLGGWAETNSMSRGRYGTLGYYDLRRGLKASYFVPETDAESSERYYQAWRSWVIARSRQIAS